jgi:hypothetical protein
MVNYDFDSDCPPLFKGTNYVLWQETMQAYIKHKDLELWEIVINGPITIDKSEDEYTEDDYKKISKNFRVINILYCALTIDIYDSVSHCDSAKKIWETLNCMYGTNYNVMLSEFVAPEEIVMDENDKQVKNCRHHEEKEYGKDDSFQDLLHDAIEYNRMMELFENGEKDKNSCHSSILKNGEYEVRSVVEFLDNNLPPTCHIFEDLSTTTNFQLSNFFSCGIKSRKCVKVERNKCFTSSISLISNNFELNMKRVLKFDQMASFLRKLIENVHPCGNLLTLHFYIDDLFSIIFKLLKIQVMLKKSKNGIW